jgi:hypothetical protein
MYLEHLTDPELEQYDCSDKIWLGRTAYEHWITSSEPGIATIIKLTNGVDQSVVGLVYSMHYNAEEDTIYVPNWMYNSLHFDDEHITITRFEGSLCTGLTIQPHTSDHLTAPDPQELLRDAFEQYSCLTPGQEVPLWICHPEPHVFYVTIVKLMPSDDTLCIRNCEMELELMPPMDLPIPSSSMMPLAMPSDTPSDTPSGKEPVISHVESVGYTLGGTIPEGKTRRELALEAALRRMQSDTPQ